MYHEPQVLQKKQRADETWVDPKSLLENQNESFRKKLYEQRNVLEDPHGKITFKGFVLSRGYQMP